MDAHHERIQLRDGSSVLIRTPTPEDADALLAFFSSQSSTPPRLSFVSRVADLEAMARWAAQPDGTDQLGLVAVDFEGKLVGHVACARIYGRRGEVAVDVDQGQRHRGIETALLNRITRDAKNCGINTLMAEVVPEQDDVWLVPNGNAPPASRTA